MNLRTICLLYFFIFSPLSYAVSEGYYWQIGSSPGGAISEAAQAHCDRIGPIYCHTYSILAYEADPSREDLRTVKFYRESGNFTSELLRRFPCSYDSDYSNTLDVCQANYEPPAQLCSDGYPANIYGYEDNCDRPNPKQCPDGSYIEESSFCSVGNGVCSDYDSCHQYAQSQANCSSNSSVFEFNYYDPNNFDFTCSDIATDSPDSPDNGGNADGNEYNDPTSPDSTTVSELDVGSLASAIGAELQDDFGNIERAIRDGINSDSANTDQITTAINNANSELNASIDSVRNAIESGSSTNNSNDIVNSINNASSSLSNTISDSNLNVISSVNQAKDAINVGNAVISSQLSDIAQGIENATPCDPSLDDKACEGVHGLNEGFISGLLGSIQSVFDEESDTALNSVKSEITDLEAISPLGEDMVTGVFDFFTDVIPSPQECIPLSFGNPAQPYHFTVSCEFSDKFKSLFSFILAVYTILQIIKILFVGATPSSKGNI